MLIYFIAGSVKKKQLNKSILLSNIILWKKTDEEFTCGNLI